MCSCACNISQIIEDYRDVFKGPKGDAGPRGPPGLPGRDALRDAFEVILYSNKVFVIIIIQLLERW